MNHRGTVRGVCTAALLLGATAAGCGGDDDDPGSPGPSVETLSYGADIAPIYYGKCVGCHQEGGIAPFRLDRYADAKQWAVPAAMATRRGYMPPFHMTYDGSCGDLQSEAALTAAEKQRIWDWANGGAAEGPAVQLPLPATPRLEGASHELKTPLFSPVAQGGALAEHDDYRCFLLDPGMTRDSFITGFEVLPGNKALVHHLLGFIVNPAGKTMSGMTNAEVMQALDDKTPDRAGWDCFGGAGDGVEPDGVPVEWAPGGGPVSYPANTGVALKTTDRLVVQLHYNLADPKVRGQTDSSTIRLRFADTVDRRLAFLLPDPFLDSLFGDGPSFSLPAGDPAYPFSWKLDTKGLGLEGLPYVDLLGIGPHMHERGRKWELRMVARPGAAKACIGKVEAWDFEWQRSYFYKSPLRLEAGGEIELTCQYDTSQDRNPVLPGWGTRNEMCLAIMMVALPPGM
jgi:hypothetical protein